MVLFGDGIQNVVRIHFLMRRTREDGSPVAIHVVVWYLSWIISYMVGWYIDCCPSSAGVEGLSSSVVEDFFWAVTPRHSVIGSWRFERTRCHLPEAWRSEKTFPPPEDEGIGFRRIVCNWLPSDTASYPGNLSSFFFHYIFWQSNNISCIKAVRFRWHLTACNGVSQILRLH